MADLGTTVCPGCGVELPRVGTAYDRKFHASAECWSTFEGVLATEYQDPVLFGRVHQLTVDAYAVQHAGGAHPDKSVCIHLVGLFLVLERGVEPPKVPPMLQRLAGREIWPHLEPPTGKAAVTVRDVARADSTEMHALQVRRWAESVWQAWAPHHDAARALAPHLFDASARKAV